MKLAPARRDDRVLMLLLIASDIVAIPVTFILTWFARTWLLAGMLPGFHHDLGVYLTALPVVAVLWFFSFARTGLYAPRRHPGGMGELQRLLKAYVTLIVSLMAASYLVKMDYSRLMLFTFTSIAIPVTVLVRFLARKLAGSIAPVRDVPRVLVVGTGEVASRIIRSIGRSSGRAPSVVGAVSTEAPADDRFEGVPVVSALEGMEEAVGSLGVDEVFFAAPELDHSRIMEVISSIGDARIHYRLVTDLFDIAAGMTGLDDLVRLPIVEIGYWAPGALHRFTKRLMDIVLSAVLLLLLMPLMLVIYVVHLLSGSGSPVFSQKRVGFRGGEFTLHKFRTMKPDCDEYEVAPVSMDDERITKLGRFLRRTSLDELPQLLNVLKGDMSLVGPRPEMPFIAEGYTSWQRHRLDVKPGLTGLWQIMGRKELPLQDNLEYDYYYIRNQSLMLDVAIMLRTVATIFKGRGAY